MLPSGPALCFKAFLHRSVYFLGNIVSTKSDMNEGLLFLSMVILILCRVASRRDWHYGISLLRDETSTPFDKSGKKTQIISDAFVDFDLTDFKLWCKVWFAKCILIYLPGSKHKVITTTTLVIETIDSTFLITHY